MLRKGDIANQQPRLSDRVTGRIRHEMSNEQDNLREFMTAKEAAAVLGVHHATVGQYCQAGELEAHKVGVAWAIKRASVERLAAARRVDTSRYTLTTKQVAKQLGLANKTVIHLCSQGDLSAVKDGNLWLIDPASVAAYQQRGTKAEPIAKPRKPRKVATPVAREEPTPWQARPEFDWTARVRARREDVLHAAIRKLRGPGQ